MGASDTALAFLANCRVADHWLRTQHDRE